VSFLQINHGLHLSCASKQQNRGSAEVYDCKTETKNSDIEVPTVGKLRYFLLLVLAESLGTSGYAFICRRSKILSFSATG